MFVFWVEFLLKAKYHLCLFTISWFEIESKTRHYQGENSSIFIYKTYKENFIKRKIVNLQMRKNKSTGWKVLKQLLQCFKFLRVCIIFLYTNLELITTERWHADNGKLIRKICFQCTFLVKFHRCSVRNFRSLKQLLS